MRTGRVVMAAAAAFVLGACHERPTVVPPPAQASPVSEHRAPPRPTPPLSQPVVGPDATIDQARSRIKHVVFLIKENRTFDTLFGTFPGADGTTTGQLCDGSTVRLRRAADRTDDVEHRFVPALRAMNGGKMNCFDRLWNGGRLQSY